MDVTWTCPSCEHVARLPLTEAPSLECPACGHSLAVPEALRRAGRVERCLVCRGADLFIRKDFSQRLGLLMIVAGFAASSVAWYFYMKYLTFGILFATALVDVLLYLWVDNLLQCYRCHAEYRGVDLHPHEPFELETHERHRQQQARLEQSRHPAAASPAAAAPPGQTRP